MKIFIDQNRLTESIGRLLQMMRDAVYPFNRDDAKVPQKLIPDELRQDKKALSLFYFFACIYMRGGIVSSTAFKLLMKVRNDYPWMFIPEEVQQHDVAEVRHILKKYIGWDSKTAGEFWHRNAILIVKNWDGNPLNIIKELRSYDDAVRFYVNKNKKGKPFKGEDGREQGFWGHQHKMASMQLYFIDWEGLLTTRFNYPGPVDFHNYRFFLTTESVILIDAGRSVSFSEKISAPVRDALMEFLQTSGEDPLDVADVIWLFSLLMCGESPHTQTRELKKGSFAPLFDFSKQHLPWDVSQWSQNKKTGLDRTCHVCAFNQKCKFAIPAGPYYGKRKSGRNDGTQEKGGKLVLRERPPLWFHLEPHQIRKSLINLPLAGEAVIYNAFEEVARPKQALHT